jgi:hypothetical protein
MTIDETDSEGHARRMRALSLAAGLMLGFGLPAAFAEKIPVWRRKTGHGERIAA